MLFDGKKWLWLLFGGLLIVGLGIFWWLTPSEVVIENTDNIEEADVQLPLSVAVSEILGQSVEGRDIVAYHYGNGDKEVLFVGGIHGGYEWNSTVLAYAVMDNLETNHESIPDDIKITVIPTLNPDGLAVVTNTDGELTAKDILLVENQGEARFNANGVDLNRNFDCNWAPESSWRGEVVSAGTGPFSEPEALALRDYVLKSQPEAVVFWHSKANAVYASECNEGVLSGTIQLMNTYSDAAGYRAVESFDAYPITGDAEGWLASIGIPAITVELSTHESVESSKNIRGMWSVVEMFSANIGD